MITAVGQSRLFQNAGDGRFADVTDKRGPRRSHRLQHVRARGSTTIATACSIS